MSTKLRKVWGTVLKDQFGTGSAQIVAGSVTGAVKVYKQGATVTTGATITSGTSITVRDTGGIVAGDTVQKGTDSSKTATVDSVNSRTSLTLTKITGTGPTFSTGDRAVVTTNRPSLFTESTGSVAYGSSNADTDAAGLYEFFTETAWVDIIFSGTGITTAALYDVEAGYSSKVIDIRDYGSLSAAILALPTEGGAIYLPDGYVCEVSSAVSVNKVNVRFVSDSWGKATIRAAGSNPAYGLLKIEYSGFVAEHIRFDHRGTSAGAYDMIQVNGLDRGVQPVTFRNCYFLNWRRNALRITGGVYNLTVTECPAGGGFGPAYFAQTSSGGTDPAQGSLGAGTPTHLRFFASEVTGIDKTSTEAAMYFSNCGPITIDGMIIEGINGGTDIASANAIHIDTGFAVRIENSHFEMATSGTYAPATNPEQLIVLSGCHGAVVRNCTVTGSATTAVQPKRFLSVGNSGRGTFWGNRVSNLKSGTKLALVLDGSSTGWVVGPNIYETSETETLQEPCVSLNMTLFKVPVYADDTARDAAGAALAVKGNIIYKLDTNKFQGYNGGWVDLH